jgi:hypothetical protein
MLLRPFRHEFALGWLSGVRALSLNLTSYVPPSTVLPGNPSRSCALPSITGQTAPSPIGHRPTCCPFRLPCDSHLPEFRDATSTSSTCTILNRVASLIAAYRRYLPAYLILPTFPIGNLSILFQTLHSRIERSWKGLHDNEGSYFTILHPLAGSFLRYHHQLYSPWVARCLSLTAGTLFTITHTLQPSWYLIKASLPLTHGGLILIGDISHHLSDETVHDQD